MKKALSLVLAIVMVLSLGVSAMANAARGEWVDTGVTITLVETSAETDATNATATPVTPGRQTGAPAANAVLVNAFNVTGAAGVQARVVMPATLTAFDEIDADASATETEVVNRVARLQINVATTATPATGFSFAGDINVPATTTHASLENITAGAHTVTAMDFADVTTTGGAADLSGVTVYPENAPFVRNGAGSFNITGLAGATGSGALPVTGAPANVVVAATLTGTTVAVTVTDNRTSGNAITFDVKIGAGSIYARITLPAVVAATNIPSNWTVDGLSNFGEIEIERQLTNNSGMTILGDSGTGADGNAVLAFLQPDYFLWRVPNTALTTQSGSGWTGGLTWADLQAQTIASITPPAGNSQTVLRSAHFNRAQLRTTRTVGFSNVVRDVRFHFHNNNTTRIQVRSVEFLTRTGDNDVEFDLSLAVTGASTARMGRAWLTVANEEIEVWDDQEFIDPSHQQFITADGTIRGLEIYAGNNMYVTRNITSGQELYIATELATHDDVFTELFREHRDLIDVIRVHTSTGWGAAGIDVRFDVADTLFVFGGPNRALLGTTDDRSLPMSEYYFLARSLINLGGAADGGTDAPVEDNNDDGFDGVPGTGGDVAPPNANFNPGTGR